ncbi:hypothetical protein HY523_00600 [Candidatus Berkelbacteria bacterium]|nr:hypothetical protein [Candidatus Berkelbacteria bacterium]
MNATAEMLGSLSDEELRKNGVDPEALAVGEETKRQTMQEAAHERPIFGEPSTEGQQPDIFQRMNWAKPQSREQAQEWVGYLEKNAESRSSLPSGYLDALKGLIDQPDQFSAPPPQSETYPSLVGEDKPAEAEPEAVLPSGTPHPGEVWTEEQRVGARPQPQSARQTTRDFTPAEAKFAQYLQNRLSQTEQPSRTVPARHDFPLPEGRLSGESDRLTGQQESLRQPRALFEPAHQSVFHQADQKLAEHKDRITEALQSALEQATTEAQENREVQRQNLLETLQDLNKQADYLAQKLVEEDEAVGQRAQSSEQRDQHRSTIKTIKALRENNDAKIADTQQQLNELTAASLAPEPSTGGTQEVSSAAQYETVRVPESSEKIVIDLDGGGKLTLEGINPARAAQIFQLLGINQLTRPTEVSAPTGAIELITHDTMTLDQFLEGYLNGQGGGDSEQDKEYQQFQQNNGPAIEAELRRRLIAEQAKTAQPRVEPQSSPQAARVEAVPVAESEAPLPAPEVIQPYDALPMFPKTETVHKTRGQKLKASFGKLVVSITNFFAKRFGAKQADAQPAIQDWKVWFNQAEQQRQDVIRQEQQLRREQIQRLTTVTAEVHANLTASQSQLPRLRQLAQAFETVGVTPEMIAKERERGGQILAKLTPLGVEYSGGRDAYEKAVQAAREVLQVSSGNGLTTESAQLTASLSALKGLFARPTEKQPAAQSVVGESVATVQPPVAETVVDTSTAFASTAAPTAQAIPVTTQPSQPRSSGGGTVAPPLAQPTEAVGQAA